MLVRVQSSPEATSQARHRAHSVPSPVYMPPLLCGGLTGREAHDVEDAVQLVVVVRVAGLDVLLPTVEDGLGRQELSKDAADGPDV